MTDYYKILNLDVEASETEIKKRFRKLATIHHPDKNEGSTKSEETFKVILNAYETLSDKEKRASYDIKYQQYYQQQKTESSYQYRTEPKADTAYSQKKKQSKHNQSPWTEYNIVTPIKSKNNFIYWVIAIIIVLVYLLNSNEKTTTGNSKADQHLEDQQPENRPKSGELDFTK